MRPRALVLQAPGTNREHDAAQALELAGAAAEVVPLQALLERAARWEGYRILVIPGGFSHGDALGAGRLLGLDLDARLHDEVHAFVDAGWPVLGICNGFQALLRAGILPGVPDVEVTLAPNRSGLFECRWVHLRTERTRCVWTHDVDSLVHCPVAHGEGAMVTSSPGMERLMAAGLVALRYVRGDGTPAGTSYPHNPSGSAGDVAGLCNPRGNVLGLMPHPENHVLPWQHPRWTRGESGQLGLTLFRQGVRYAAQR